MIIYLNLLKQVLQYKVENNTLSFGQAYYLYQEKSNFILLKGLL